MGYQVNIGYRIANLTGRIGKVSRSGTFQQEESLEKLSGMIID